METNSHPEAAASNVKQGQYSPRKRKDTTPRVNPQLAVELVYQELKRVEVYTKRIEDATARKVQIDGKSLESAENRLKNVLAARQIHQKGVQAVHQKSDRSSQHQNEQNRHDRHAQQRNDEDRHHGL